MWGGKEEREVKKEKRDKSTLYYDILVIMVNSLSAKMCLFLLPNKTRNGKMFESPQSQGNLPVKPNVRHAIDMSASSKEIGTLYPDAAHAYTDNSGSVGLAGASSIVYSDV